MIARHATNLHFFAATGLGLATAAIAFFYRPMGLLGLLPSIAYTVWAIRRSDTKGFVNTGQVRRAFEPERHFNGLQTGLLIVLLMVQAFVAAYALVG